MVMMVSGKEINTLFYKSILLLFEKVQHPKCKYLKELSKLLVRLLTDKSFYVKNLYENLIVFFYN